MATALKRKPALARTREPAESVVIRIAGDSGDGIQLTGTQFTITTALSGNDLATFPDFPAEIRAPAGTTFGVSAFQINFGARKIQTSGDAPDVLVALNPAALKVSIDELRPGGTLIVNSGAFTHRNLAKAGYSENPIKDGKLRDFQVFEIDISKLTLDAVKKFDLSQKEALRCKNMWTLGLLYWMYDRSREATIEWLTNKFRERPVLAKANIAALNAGHAFGETAELSSPLPLYKIPAAHLEPGLYRNVTGTEALAWGLLTGAHLADLEMTFCSYPITPASGILHVLAQLRPYGVTTFQAEDEIAAVCAAIGASYGGALGVTSSSGPGMALKTEGIGLAIATELPLVIVDTQRAGPSTGMPTKTEQSDLYLTVFGRNADSPLVVLAARSPSDCFDMAIESVRIATKYRTPVILLSDTYIANASEPWHIPDLDKFEAFPVRFPTADEGESLYRRDEETLARVWVRPGTPGLEHRIGGLEKDFETGEVSYDPENHQRMTEMRAAKVARVATDIPEQKVELGGESGCLAVVGWGSTYGPINRAVGCLRDEGLDVSHIHISYLSPLPPNLGEVLARFDKVLVPEMNCGQLLTLLRSTYLVPAEGYNRVTGKPFRVGEIEAAIRERLEKK